MINAGRVSPEPNESWWWKVASVLVGCGVLLRLQQYGLARSLWIDEARLAFSIAPLHDATLVGPLLYDQVAPPGFLVLSRVAVLALGPNELALRVVPLIAGVGALGATALLARRVGGGFVACLAALMLAASPAALYYSSEFKHYSLDLLFAVLLPLAAMAVYRTSPPRGAKAGYVTLCLLAPWFSASGMIVASGTLSALAAIGIVTRRRAVFVLASAGGAAALCSFSATYALAYRFASQGELMLEFWEGAYLSARSPDAVVSSIVLLMSAIWGMIAGARPLAQEWIGSGDTAMRFFALLALGAMVACCCGALMLAWRGRRAEAAILCGPFALFVIVSLLGLYPASTRLLLFLAGPGVVLAAVGVTEVGNAGRRMPGRAITVLLVSVVIVATMPADGRWRMADTQWSAASVLVRQARAMHRPIYLSARGVPQYLYYSTDWSSADRTSGTMLYAVSDYGGAAFENAGNYETGRADTLLARLAEEGLLVGLPTGMQFQHSTGWSRPQPADGWALTETARIDSLRTNSIAMLFMHHIDGAARYLVREMERAGWRCSEELRNYQELLLTCDRSVGSS